jgi:hypothetical protein
MDSKRHGPVLAWRKPRGLRWTAETRDDLLVAGVKIKRHSASSRIPNVWHLKPVKPRPVLL